MENRFDTTELGKGDTILCQLKSRSLCVGDAVVDTFAFATRRARTLLSFFEATFGFAFLVVCQSIKVRLVGKICSSANIL